jgi:hypothetical protein
LAFHFTGVKLFVWPVRLCGICSSPTFGSAILSVPAALFHCQSALPAVLCVRCLDLLFSLPWMSWWICVWSFFLSSLSDS